MLWLRSIVYSFASTVDIGVLAAYEGNQRDVEGAGEIDRETTWRRHGTNDRYTSYRGLL